MRKRGVDVRKERKRFWNNLDKVVDRVGNWYRLCVVVDMGRTGITRTFGV